MNRHGRETGSAALEVMLLTPLLLLLVGFVLAAGRVELAHSRVDTVAAQAARAAAATGNPALATVAAGRIAAAALSASDLSCTRQTVRVDVSDYRAGGVVRVQVTCRTDLSALLPGLPGQRDVSGTATAVIDVYRQVAP